MCRKNAFNAIFGHWMYPNPSIASALKFFNFSIIFNKKLTLDNDLCCFLLFGAGSTFVLPISQRESANKAIADSPFF